MSTEKETIMRYFDEWKANKKKEQLERWEREMTPIVEFTHRVMTDEKLTAEQKFLTLMEASDKMNLLNMDHTN